MNGLSGFALGAVILSVIAACGAIMAGDAPVTATVELRGVDEKVYRPLRMEEGMGAVVVIFVCTDCPIANGYAPEINRIVADYRGKGMGFYLVHADPDTTAEAARKHATDFSFACPVLLDHEQKLMAIAGATVTPQCVVFDRELRIVYSGRIDDRYSSLGKERKQATSTDLRDALDDVAGGKAVRTQRTAAVGCTIPVAQAAQATTRPAGKE